MRQAPEVAPRSLIFAFALSTLSSVTFTECPLPHHIVPGTQSYTSLIICFKLRLSAFKTGLSRQSLGSNMSGEIAAFEAEIKEYKLQASPPHPSFPKDLKC